jgi:hypothetical protein
MTNVFAIAARQLVLVLLVTAGMAAEGVRTPVFRGVMGLGKREIALFEVQGNAGTWQGEAGRTLPGSQWTIDRIDMRAGTVVIRLPGKPPVTLKQGETYFGDRAVQAPEPVRASAVEPRAPPPAYNFRGSESEKVLQQQFARMLGDPAVLRKFGIPTGPGSAAAHLAHAMREQPATPRAGAALGLAALAGGPRPQAPATATAVRGRVPAPAPSALVPSPAVPGPAVANPAGARPMPPAVPLIRALDASRTVPALTTLGKPGYQTIVMMVSAGCPVCRALKPKVLGLPSKRPRTAVVFVDIGVDEKGAINVLAPVREAWNVTGLPHFILFDATGRISASGAAAQETVEAWIAGQ